MRRRLAASPIAAFIAVLSLSGTVAAWEPSGSPTGPGMQLGPRSTSTGVSPKAVNRKTGSRRAIESAPGANGLIAFGESPADAWPSAIWTTDVSGSDYQELTPGGTGEGDYQPAWSPGGTMVAFARDMTPDTATFTGDIWLIGADGTGLKRLTTSTARDASPDWTPDGSRILFASDRSGKFDVYSMKPDGSDVRRLTSNAANDVQPTVSPDGRHIAFASDRSGNFEIYTMDVDGSNVARLTSAAGDDYDPDWSPDGTEIAFTSGRTGDWEIFSMQANGALETDLTQDTSQDFDPSWAPDGSSIVFGSTYFGDYDLFLLDLTSGSQTLITDSYDDELSPDWQPVPAFPLVDARFSSFDADIQWVFDQGITKGCTAERYCPADAVTREQMAIFLDRALKLPATTTDYFSDDTGRTGEAAINRVAAAGITSGCSAGHYCPTDTVTRGAMASFLARAFALPAAIKDYFTDDDGTTHEANINRVAAAGITSGCTPTTYCPGANVTRGQMAAFLRRALAT